MALYSPLFQKTQTFLQGNTSFQSLIDGQINKFVESPKASFFIATDLQNPVFQELDIVQNTIEEYNANVTESPIEDGTPITQHVSKPTITFQITGSIHEFVNKVPRQAEFEEVATATLNRYGRYAPSLAEPVQKIINRGISQINKIQSYAEGTLSDVRNFYKVVNNFGKANFEKRYEAVAKFLRNIIQERIEVVLHIHKVRYINCILTNVKFEQKPMQNNDDLYITLSFKVIYKVSTVTQVQPFKESEASERLQKETESLVTKVTSGIKTTLSNIGII